MRSRTENILAAVRIGGEKRGSRDAERRTEGDVEEDEEEKGARHGVSSAASNLTAGGTGSILLLAASERQRAETGLMLANISRVRRTLLLLLRCCL